MPWSQIAQVSKAFHFAFKVYMTRHFSLFERAFKMMKNGVYFIVIALLVAELFKILVYENKMTWGNNVDTKWWCKAVIFRNVAGIPVSAS